MTAAVAQREIRRVQVGTQLMQIGALAGTTTQHPHTAGPALSTACLACFGWLDDPRHIAHRRAVAGRG